MGGKTSNIAFHFVLQECCKTSCTFFLVLFPVPLDMIIANEESSFTSYATRARGIIVSYFIFPLERALKIKKIAKFKSNTLVIRLKRAKR